MPFNILVQIDEAMGAGGACLEVGGGPDGGAGTGTGRSRTTATTHLGLSSGRGGGEGGNGGRALARR
jgi:hypothetical protein